MLNSVDGIGLGKTIEVSCILCFESNKMDEWIDGSWVCYWPPPFILFHDRQLEQLFCETSSTAFKKKARTYLVSLH